MQLTKEGLLKALRAQGMPDTAADLASVEKWLADNPRRLVFDGKDVDLKAVFAPVVTLEPETKKADPEPVIQLDEKVAAMVADAVAKATGKKPGDGAPPKTVNLDGNDRLGPEDVKVKSLEAAWKRNPGRVFDTHEKAWAFGNGIIANVLAGVPGVSQAIVEHAKSNCAKLAEKGYLTFPNSAGGALTATQFSPEIISQLDQFGVLARHAYVVPMTDTRFSQPKAEGYLTVSYPEEGTAPSTTQQTWSNISLLAKMGIAIVKMSRNINADAIANLGDHTARELARSFARQEDLNGFNGNGTATYGGMQGVINKFGATATADSRSVTGGDTTAAHTMPNLHAVMGKLPSWARPGAAWYCHPTIAALVFDRLGAAQGGVTWQEVMGFGYVRKFLGHPVVEVEVMNSNDNTGGDVVDILFGNMREAVALGRRQDLTVELSDQRYWDEHNLGMKGVIRHDVNVYSLGSTTTAGPLVALYQT